MVYLVPIDSKVFSSIFDYLLFCCSGCLPQMENIFCDSRNKYFSVFFCFVYCGCAVEYTKRTCFIGFTAFRDCDYWKKYIIVLTSLINYDLFIFINSARITFTFQTGSQYNHWIHSDCSELLTSIDIDYDTLFGERRQFYSDMKNIWQKRSANGWPILIAKGVSSILPILALNITGAVF